MLSTNLLIYLELPKIPSVVGLQGPSSEKAEDIPMAEGVKVCTCGTT